MCAINLVGAFGKVLCGTFTDESDKTVIEVAVKTMKGYKLFSICTT